MTDEYTLWLSSSKYWYNSMKDIPKYVPHNLCFSNVFTLHCQDKERKKKLKIANDSTCIQISEKYLFMTPKSIEI